MDIHQMQESPNVSTHRLSRRRLTLLASAMVAGLGLGSASSPQTDARKRKRQPRNVTVCHEGQTIQVRRKRQQKHLNHGESLGPCPVPPVVRDLPALVDAAAPGSTITLDAGIWNISRPVRLMKNLSIVGAGRGQTILDGGANVRVIEAGNEVACSIENLTIRRGYTDRSDAGGGISNRGTLTLRNVEVSNCMSEYPGGGIGNDGSLHMTSCLVADNAAQQLGGGIYNNGDLHLIGSTITRNRILEVAAGGNGGGLTNGGTVTMDAASSIVNNTPDNCGGRDLPAACGN